MAQLWSQAASPQSDPLHEDTPLLNDPGLKGIWRLPFVTHRFLSMMLTTGAAVPSKIAMPPPTPEIIAISIQPDPSSDHLQNVGGDRNGNVGGTPLTTMATLKPVDSAPSFIQMGSRVNSASDVLTLNSSNSVNSLIPRDELSLQHQKQQLGGSGDSDPNNVGLQMVNGGGSPDGPGMMEVHQESAKAIALQVSFPFLVAGFGMVGAGLLLDEMQHWEVFEKVSEIMVLVPSLLGLKGNLEMTLASRLSTQANLGTFDKRSDQFTLIAGNLALIECQAIVVSFLASWFAILVGFISAGNFNVSHAFLVCASSMLTAAGASIILGLTMVGVIVVSRRLNINPDNVATPIAASLGDVTSLAILAGVATLLYSIIDKMVWAGPIITVACLGAVPVLVLVSRKNKYTAEALKTGWLPVISAMVISSVAGFIFDEAISKFNDIAVFQPVVNGVGGNLVAIHASRISTSLHSSSQPGLMPSFHPKVCVNPCVTFFGKDIHKSTARVLMMLVIPGHLIFVYVICYVKTGAATLTFSFVSVYLLVAVVQVAALLYISLIWTHWMWFRKLDPDSCSIPYLTALGDLFGVALLTIAFEFLDLINEGDIGVRLS